MNYEGLGNERLYPLACKADKGAIAELAKRGNRLVENKDGGFSLEKTRYFENRIAGGRRELVKATVRDGRLVEGSIEPVTELPPGAVASVGGTVPTDRHG